ncbi:MAG: type I-E CRISPR-associated protein Cas5/CasD [Chloroflexi bacterium]|nr:type I-E CRISPR-associated protein Cas5/CasD [Chloroflexota bacterium]
MLACALGLNADEDLRVLSRALRVGVRYDKPGVMMEDFHTVVGGVMSAEGKVKINATTRQPETVVSHRAYLSDASFLAVVQADDPSLIARLADAIQGPVWPIYLGRKSCPPSLPPFEGTGTYPSLKAALETAPLWSNWAGESKRVRIVIEVAPGEGTRRRDEIDSRVRRTFLPRYVYDDIVDLITQYREI